VYLLHGPGLELAEHRSNAVGRQVRVLNQCGQATKGAWGMSWRQKTMTGVENCEKSGVAVKQALIPVWGRSIGGTLRGPMKYLHLEHYFSHCIAKKLGGVVRLRPLLLALISKNVGRQSARAGPLHLERNRWGGSGCGGGCGVKAQSLRGLGSTPSQFPFECRGALLRADALPL
jgi:hypothetical protein